MKVFWKKSLIIEKETPPCYQDTKINFPWVVYKIRIKDISTSVFHRQFKYMFPTGHISIPTPNSTVSINGTPNFPIAHYELFPPTCPPSVSSLNMYSSLPCVHPPVSSLSLQWLNPTIISYLNNWSKLLTGLPAVNLIHWNICSLSKSWGRPHNSFP